MAWLPGARPRHPDRSGKTTLASVLLAKLKTGGELAGLPLQAGRAIVVSEESYEHWKRRTGHLDFGDHVGWHCQPFLGKPRPGQWLDFLDQLAEECVQQAVSLVVIDSWAAFMPGCENDAGAMLEALLPLQRLTTAGVAVWPQHHPRKAKSPAGQAARGSGALPSYVDILIEKRFYRRNNDQDRRRKLKAYSRFTETLRQWVIELNAAGTDYRSLGSFEDEEFADSWRLLTSVLETAPRKLSRRELLKRWPAGRVPDETTLARWLERAVAEGWLSKSGPGTRTDPYRYWLPSREAVWRQDPFAALHMPELFTENNAE
jgi:hypothetical protein